MKFKTWEKVYWGIISVLFTFVIITTIIHEGDIPVKIQGGEKLISKTAFVGYALLGYAIIFVPIWLVVRWIINRSGEREREIKNRSEKWLFREMVR